MSLYGNIYQAHIDLGDYREAIKWQTKLIRINSKDRLDIRSQARIHLIMCHFEIGNFELLPGLLNDAAKWYEKNGILFRYENHMLGFFRKHFLRPLNQNKAREDFKILIHKTSGNQRNTKVPEFITWMGSKLK